ncbi:MAG: MMPL family transporter, partial [Candidatus Binatia bacterium]
ALRRALEQNGFEVKAFDGALEDLVRDDRPRLTLASQKGGPLEGLIDQHLRSRNGETVVATYFMPAPGTSLGAVRDRLRAELPGLEMIVTGRELVEREFRDLLERELLWFLGAALALNLAVVFYSERSFARGLATFAPTLAALLIYLGAIGALDIAIDPVNLIVLPLLIGLGVDDSVYLVAHSRSAGGLGEGARRGAMPLLCAVATTVAGFGSLGLSRYPALARLGWLATFALLLCAIATMVLIPVLISVLGERRRDGVQPVARDSITPQLKPSR